MSTDIPSLGVILVSDDGTLDLNTPPVTVTHTADGAVTLDFDVNFGVLGSRLSVMVDTDHLITAVTR